MTSSTSEIKVWTRFERKLRGGHTVKLKIQELPKGRHLEVAKFMEKSFIHEESWNKTCGVPDNPNAVEESKLMISGLLSESPALLCCLDSGVDFDEDKQLALVGCNALFISKKDELFDLKFESEELSKLFKIMELTDKYNNIYEKYDVTEYLSGAGLCVDPKYRGCGIAEELLKARRPLCEHLGIGVTAAIFTGAASQRAAERAGYELVAEVDYQSFGELCGVRFLADAPSFKILALHVK